MSDSSDSDSLKSSAKKVKQGTRRLTKYNCTWERDYDWLCASMSKNEYKIFCRLCNKEFSISHGGQNDVQKHSKGISHKSIVSARAAMNLTDYFGKPGTSTFDVESIYKISAAEITSVYHNIKHSLSYNSMDCFQKLLPTMYSDSKIAKNVKCGRTKSEAIVCGILAKEALKDIIINLQKDLYFSISTDASNNGNRKLFPVCVRFFSRDVGLESKLLDFVESNSETADAITKVLYETLERHNISMSNVSSYGADNANVNFGCNHSVYTNLVQKNKNILKANCSIHILHNMSKFACDRLEIDVESLILKIYSHFSHSAKRRQELIEVFESSEMDWLELLRHVQTRFLSLSPAVERILKVWPALKLYFTKLEKGNCPKMIEKIFQSEEEEIKTLAYFNFVHNIMSSFGTVMKEYQSDEIVITEMHEELCQFRNKLDSRLHDNFFGFQTKQLLNKLDSTEKTKIIDDLKKFYENCKQYLDPRYDFSRENIFAQLSFITMKNEISFESIGNAVSILNLNDEIDIDLLYEEFSSLKPSIEVIAKNSKDLTAQKWHQLFKLFPEKDTKNIFKLISFILSIPTSNCFPERVFSQMNLKWSDARNKCSVELIKSELLVQFNKKFSCAEFYHYIKQQKETLREVKSSAKYK